MIRYDTILAYILLPIGRHQPYIQTYLQKSGLELLLYNQKEFHHSVNNIRKAITEKNFQFLWVCKAWFGYLGLGPNIWSELPHELHSQSGSGEGTLWHPCCMGNNGHKMELHRIFPETLGREWCWIWHMIPPVAPSDQLGQRVRERDDQRVGEYGRVWGNRPWKQ